MQGVADQAEGRRLRRCLRGRVYRQGRDQRFRIKGLCCGGVLGSTEILLRSQRENTLPLSQALGTKFSTNGDFGGFAYKTTKPDKTVLPCYTTRGRSTLHTSA